MKTRPLEVVGRPDERALPVWLADIEARLRSGHSTFGAKTVQELMELCKAQRKALKVAVMRPLHRCHPEDLEVYAEAQRLWEGK